MTTISVEQSGAFIETFSLEPTATGPLEGLCFAVKDLIDVAGKRTGCGNPTWLETHPPAIHTAVCVEQLLASGARCVGKTITDEIAFSLGGENFFYGTPLNPAAPDRVPGGSSSGSASAVACGLADFALGTDTGGSVRIPASNCGIFGIRPTHGLVSVAGVMPFAPGLDTVGILARDADVLCRVAGVLLGPESEAGFEPGSIHLVREAFDIAEPEVREALRPALACLGKLFGGKVRETSLGTLCGTAEAADLSTWLRTFSTLQWAEIQNTTSGWIAGAKPRFGPQTTANFEMIASVDRTRLGEAVARREHYSRPLRHALGTSEVLCMPTAPMIAPLKGEIRDRSGNYYRHTLSLTAIAGLARLPQVSLPLATARGAPIGLSLLMAPGEESPLLQMVARLAAAWGADSSGDSSAVQ